MSVELKEEAGGKILMVKMTGKLTKADYEHLGPTVDRAVQQHGKVRMLVHMHDFHGWTMGALWQDIKFDFKHFAHLERVAFVGERKWEAGMAVFCKPFTTATIRYFDASQIHDADTWIHEGISQPV
jgi:stage II sporulation SpoAA-like protein